MVENDGAPRAVGPSSEVAAATLTAIQAARERVRRLVDSTRFQLAVTVLIMVNAASLGLDTMPAVMRDYGDWLEATDRVCLMVFTVELGLRAFAHGKAFLRDPWCMFDALVVGIALTPSAGGLSVLRALRILRVLRLISAVPSLRRVVGALLTAMPGMASITGLLVLILYVAGVMATKLFGSAMPAAFGSLGDSLFTLFQIMTGDNWSDVAREVMHHQPLSWIFFVLYILVSTFAVLNLFMAVVVSAMESQISGELADDIERAQEEDRQRDVETLDAVKALSEDVAAMRDELARLRPA
ncbi:ion transporter [Actinomadura barringtoniae]|uniref:Ion transporter n=1 Tax=Actinomadura barringtoniae TaxID=1427535 RepID=A0A939PC92_9ACTN|nr:ion transporter [Actinomadura barringtoniae]MBO2449945.1 ion transporter [Actinomadura barringtoniae]